MPWHPAGPAVVMTFTAAGSAAMAWRKSSRETMIASISA
jgi:hypothetical protein